MQHKSIVESEVFSFRWYGVVGTVIISLFGSMFHFAYQWSGCNIFVGSFVAVNESVFEHLKILTLPILLFWLLDGLAYGNVSEHTVAAAAAVYCGVAFLVVVYTITTIASGYESLWFDILLFVASAFVSQCAGWYCVKQKYTCTVTWSACLVGCAVFCHIFFTDHPPELPVIFQDPKKFYGRPAEC